MKLSPSFQRLARDNRWVAGALGLLLVVLTLIYTVLLRSRELPDELLGNRVLLFVLGYVNLVLILAIGFVLFRNLFKLAIERRHRLLGSKLRTKLVLTYVGLSLVPVILLFVYGTGLLQGWMDRWFDEPAIRQVAEQGYDVAQELNRQLEATLARDARQALRALEDIDLADPASRPRLDRVLRRELEQLEVAFLAVYDGTQFVHGLVAPRSGLRELPEPGRSFLASALQEGRAVRRLASSPDGPAPVVIAAASQRVAIGAPQPLVVAGGLLDAVAAAQAAELIRTRQSLRQFELQRDDIHLGFFLLFLMVTLVLLLAVSWAGLYLARRITRPIEALAEGTRRVAGGELAYRVDVPADDELGHLVESFNRMTADLEANERELTRAHDRLAAERAQLAAVLHGTAAGVVSVDPEGRVLTCNGAALQMLREPGGEWIGKPIREAWPDAERGKLAALLAGPSPDEPFSRTVRLVLGEEWRTFEARVTAMRGRDGALIGRVMVLEDLTDLINAQQMAVWSEAARRVAHEIKNPLTPIKLTAERLLKKQRQGDPHLADSLAEGMEIIVREVEGMQAMVDEFSRFARMPRPQPAAVDMERLLGETLHLYRGIKPGVTVEGAVAPEAATAWLDGEQLKRALINLLDNAVAAVEAPGGVRVAVERADGALRIRVADTGEGIPEEVKQKLFLPHFSTKGRGTGLGLSIVRRIVTEHHGTVRVEDNVPKGTVFTIELPQG